MNWNELKCVHFFQQRMWNETTTFSWNFIGFQWRKMVPLMKWMTCSVSRSHFKTIGFSWGFFRAVRIQGFQRWGQGLGFREQGGPYSGSTADWCAETGQQFCWGEMTRTKPATWCMTVFVVCDENKKVLIATCKQLVWSNRIGRNMPIWVLWLMLGSGPGADLPLELTGYGVGSLFYTELPGDPRSFYNLSFYYYLIHLFP
jgi:hypothetical protein